MVNIQEERLQGDRPEVPWKQTTPISDWFDKENFVIKESLPSVFEEKPESDNMTKVTSSQIARQKVQREVCLGSVSGIKIDNDDQSWSNQGLQACITLSHLGGAFWKWWQVWPSPPSDDLPSRIPSGRPSTNIDMFWLEKGKTSKFAKPPGLGSRLKNDNKRCWDGWHCPVVGSSVCGAARGEAALEGRTCRDGWAGPCPTS